jgi:hypothetical protein
MMEGGSLEPVEIKVPKVDVEVVVSREEFEECVMDVVSFSEEPKVVPNESVSYRVVVVSCNDGEYVESVDEEFVRCRALPMA